MSSRSKKGSDSMVVVVVVVGCGGGGGGRVCMDHVTRWMKGRGKGERDGGCSGCQTGANKLGQLHMVVTTVSEIVCSGTVEYVVITVVVYVHTMYVAYIHSK